MRAIQRSGDIYTTAFSKPTDISTNWVRLQTDDIKTQRLEIQKTCIHEFAQLKSLSEDSISIKNNRLGIPEPYIEDSLQKECVSMTHHGYYGGFAIVI